MSSNTTCSGITSKGDSCKLSPMKESKYCLPS